MRQATIVSLAIALMAYLPIQGQILEILSASQASENYEQYYDVAIVNGSGYYVGNSVNETSDILITHLSPEGEIIWTKKYDTGASEFGHRIISTSDGGFAIAGWTTVNKSDDLFAMKCSEEGAVEWAITHGGAGIDRGRGIGETDEGDFVIVGHSNSNSLGLNDIFVVKVDADGNLIWKNKYGSTANENGWDVETLSDGSHMITGNGGIGPAFNNLTVTKIQGDGTLDWINGYGSTEGSTAGTSSHLSLDNSIIVAGWTEASGAGGRDMYTAIINSSGELLWDATLGTEGFDTANGVDLYSAGKGAFNLLLSGTTNGLNLGTEGANQPLVVNILEAEFVDSFVLGNEIPEGELFGVAYDESFSGACIYTGGLEVTDDNVNAFF